MKKIFAILFICSISFIACEGPEGPPGPPGLDGESGNNFLAQTFEIENINFVPGDDSNATVNVVIPNDIEVFESDVPLVYIIDPLASSENRVDVWEPLPRTFFFDDGGFAQFRYNFIFDANTGIFDLDIVLETDNFSSLDTTFTQNQIFRIVIVPSDFATNTKVDLKDYKAVQKALNLKQ